MYMKYTVHEVKLIYILFIKTLKQYIWGLDLLFRVDNVPSLFLQMKHKNILLHNILMKCKRKEK